MIFIMNAFIMNAFIMNAYTGGKLPQHHFTSHRPLPWDTAQKDG
jgi:hypothetical protein